MISTQSHFGLMIPNMIQQVRKTNAARLHLRENARAQEREEVGIFYPFRFILSSVTMNKLSIVFVPLYILRIYNYCTMPLKKTKLERYSHFPDFE